MSNTKQLSPKITIKAETLLVKSMETSQLRHIRFPIFTGHPLFSYSKNFLYETVYGKTISQYEKVNEENIFLVRKYHE